MTQETTPQVAEVDSGINEAEAASEILKRMGVGNEPPAEEQEPQEEAESTEPEEGTPSEEVESEGEPEESDEIEIDIGGDKIKVPAAAAEVARKVEAKVKDIEAGATRRFQEAAELRRVAEGQIEHAKQQVEHVRLLEQEVEILADKRLVDRRLQQILSIDTAALYESDPAQLARLTAEAQQLQFASKRLEEALSQAREQSTARKSQSEQARLNQLKEWSAKNLNGFSEQEILDFSVKEIGADPSLLREILLRGGEPVLRVLQLAHKGWKVSRTDPKAKQVVSTKTLKPGATGQTKSSAQQAADTATRRFAQTKKVDDAGAAIFARMQAARKR